MFVKKKFVHLYFEIRSRGVSTRLQRKGVGVCVSREVVWTNFPFGDIQMLWFDQFVGTAGVTY